MKQFILAFSMCIILTSCHYSYLGLNNPKDDFVGTWVSDYQSQNTYSVIFRKDNTYSVESKEGQSEPLEGHFAFYLGRIKLTDETPIEGLDCSTPGFYDYTLQDKRVEFREYAEQCDFRRTIFSQPMIKLEPPQKNVNSAIKMPTGSYMSR